MITRIPVARQTPSWQQELAEAIRSPEELFAVLGLDPALLPAAAHAARQFPLRVPRGFVARMGHGDPADPLLRQVLPLADELQSTPGYGPDPVGDLASMVAPGVLHKYRGRVLAVATGACAIHCRYCFRRQFPYPDAQARADQWRSLIDYVETRGEIDELILSGGDPLSLGDRRLQELLQGAASIAHLKTVRFHTRLPVVIPSRITDGFIDMVRKTRLQIVVVLHVNHHRELDTGVGDAARRLREAGATLLNQAVLLRGVNDDPGVLAQLSQALFSTGILPYYLHMLDPVEGAAHFAVADDQARQLMGQLNATLPGYLVPRLVREVPGAASKMPLAI